MQVESRCLRLCHSRARAASAVVHTICTQYIATQRSQALQTPTCIDNDCRYASRVSTMHAHPTQRSLAAS